MDKLRPALICIMLLLASGVRAAPSPEAELGALMDMLPGVYTGMAPKALAQDGEMQTLVHRFVVIEAPQFGPRVLYYQISSGTADGPVLQAKIFVFNMDPDRPFNSMRAFILDPAQAGTALYSDPARLAALRPSELMSFPDTCFFRWGREGNGFTGISAETCRYPSRAFGQRIRPEMRYRVSADQFEWTEALHGEDGNAIVSTGGPRTALRQQTVHLQPNGLSPRP